MTPMCFAASLDCRLPENGTPRDLVGGYEGERYAYAQQSREGILWWPVDNQRSGTLGAKRSDEVIIGGLRCLVCGTLFRPGKTTAQELCRACHYQAAFRERFQRKDPRFLRRDA